MINTKNISLLIILTTMIACTKSVNHNIAARTPSSDTSFTIEGVIKNVSCDPISGLGIMQLQSRVQTSLKVTWYRIRSKELCAKNIESQLNGHTVSSIIEIAALNALNEELTISRVTLDSEDYIIDVSSKERILSKSFMEDISYFEESNSTNSHYWYFNDVLGSR